METLGESLMYDTPEFSLDDDIEDLKIDDFDSLGEELPVPEQFDELSVPLVEGDSEELSLDDDMEDLEIDDFDDMDTDLDLDSDELSLDDDFDFDDMDDEAEDSLEAEDFEIDLDDNEIFEEKSESISENKFDETEDSNFDNEDDYTPSILSESEMVQSKEKKGGNPFLIALLVLVAIAAIAGISYLLFRSLQGEDSPALEATHSTSSGAAEESVSQEAQSDSVVVIPEKQAESADTASKDAAPQTESTNEEQPIDDATTVPGPVLQEVTKITDTTGVWYKIRWGDTLWGISYSFYDSPKDYNDIVKENKIKNPDIIFAETEIFIPSR